MHLPLIGGPVSTMKWGVVFTALALAGCGRHTTAGQDEGGVGTGTGSAAGSTETTTDGTDTTGAGSYTPLPDLPPPACDPETQDCPDGETCVEGEAGFECAEAGSLGLGERCESSPGTAPCDEGLVCMAWHHETTVGICMALCQPDQPETWCEDTWGFGIASCFKTSDHFVCDSDCSSHADDCPEGLVCSTSRVLDTPFECMAPGSALDGDPCEHSVECAPGNFCVGAQWLADCDHEACCNPLCDPQGDPGTCPHPDEGCFWWCTGGDQVPGDPRCQCASDWDCARGLCHVEDG